MNPVRNVCIHIMLYTGDALLSGTCICAFTDWSFSYYTANCQVDEDEGFSIFDVNCFYSKINMLDTCDEEYNAWRDLE